MLIHITPRLYLPFVSVAKPKLERIELPELDRVLTADRDFTVRTPYANEKMLVACPKREKKQVGLCFMADNSIDTFTMNAHWRAFDGSTLNHIVQYSLEDSEFDTVSDDIFLWGRLINGAGHFGNRTPTALRVFSPHQLRPTMEIVPLSFHLHAHDIRDNRGIILERRQSLSMPTIERNRLLSRHNQQRGMFSEAVCFS
ncbi:DUF6012 family protein [Vibrio mediterranei]